MGHERDCSALVPGRSTCGSHQHYQQTDRTIVPSKEGNSGSVWRRPKMVAACCISAHTQAGVRVGVCSHRHYKLLATFTGTIWLSSTLQPLRIIYLDYGKTYTYQPWHQCVVLAFTQKRREVMYLMHGLNQVYNWEGGQRHWQGLCEKDRVNIFYCVLGADWYFLKIGGHNHQWCNPVYK